MFKTQAGYIATIPHPSKSAKSDTLSFFTPGDDIVQVIARIRAKWVNIRILNLEYLPGDRLSRKIEQV